MDSNHAAIAAFITTIAILLFLKGCQLLLTRRHDKAQLIDYAYHMLNFHLYVQRYDEGEYPENTRVFDTKVLIFDSIELQRSFVDSEGSIVNYCVIFAKREEGIVAYVTRQEIRGNKIKTLHHKELCTNDIRLKHIEEIYDELKFEKMMG